VAWSNLGAINHLQGNAVKAREYTAKARELQPYSPEVQYNYACVQARADNTGEAVAALRLAVTKRPSLREEALRDADFAALRANAEFRALTGGR
jgi:predicted Zn-dependent protease